MKGRRQQPRASTHAVNVDDFPALRDFLAGYLHEDFVLEHGTPENAVRAFRADADPGELDSVQRDAARFAQAIEDWPWADARGALRRLGAAWVPGSRSALDALLTNLTRVRSR